MRIAFDDLAAGPGAGAIACHRHTRTLLVTAASNPAVEGTPPSADARLLNVGVKVFERSGLAMATRREGGVVHVALRLDGKTVDTIRP